MAFTKSADGIAKKGKTEGKNYGDSGPVAKMMHGGKGKAKGVTGEAMRAVGRNMARANNQTRG
jgi:hypothetical protein|tara:strand:- start:4644 stop:4832 length:189 start_codon:yes stop_codon:yes gene_type:complete